MNESQSSEPQVARDAAIGLVAAYVVTVGICLLALDGNWKIALLGSLLPALFAGPFVGVLLTLRTYLAQQAETPRAHGVLVTVSSPRRGETVDAVDASIGTIPLGPIVDAVATTG